MENCDALTFSAYIVVLATLESLSTLINDLYKVQVKHLEANVVLQLQENLPTTWILSFLSYDQLHLLQKEKKGSNADTWQNYINDTFGANAFLILMLINL